MFCEEEVVKMASSIETAHMYDLPEERFSARRPGKKKKKKGEKRKKTQCAGTFKINALSQPFFSHDQAYVLGQCETRLRLIMSRDSSLSIPESQFILEALRQNTRLDNRELEHFRPLKISFGDDYGHVKVQLGKTRFVR